MSRSLAGQILMTVVLVVSGVAVVAFQWNSEHILNPDWHPHARFHVAQGSLFVVGMLVIALWLVWRRSNEPAVARRVVLAIVLVGLSVGFIAPLVPGAGLSPDLDDANTFEVAGMTIYGNVFFLVVMMIVTLVAHFLMARGESGAQKHGDIGTR